MDRARAALTAFRANPDTLDDLYRAICQDIVEHVGSSRASIWLFNGVKDAITSQCLFDSRDGTFSSGVTLSEDDFPQYFDAIKRDLKIVAPDAEHHPATSCFDEIYFTPLDIRSLLDFVILEGTSPIAVLCCEHCGVIKDWTEADVKYLHQMSAVLGMTFKVRAKAG